MSHEEEGMLDQALAASLAWHDAEEARRRRRDATRERGTESPAISRVETCQMCAQPFLHEWGQCNACGYAAQHEATTSRESRPNSSSPADVDHQLNRAIAMSLHAGSPSLDLPGPHHHDPSHTSLDPDQDDTSLDIALAGSLSNLWECLGCSSLNTPAAMQCSTCGEFVNSSVEEAVTLETARDAVTTFGAGGGGGGRSYSGLGESSRELARCGLPGCGARSNLEAHFGFCCSEHRHRAQAKGLLSPSHPNVERAFAGPDGTWSAHVLTRKHPARQPVVDQFLGAWCKQHFDHNGVTLLRPRVQRVLALRPPPEILTRFSDNLAAKGNACRLFHGTSMTCDFGIDPSAAPCASRQCAVCNICRSGFALDRAGSAAGRTLALRFGRGLYFSSTSGKSHDYGEASERRRPDGSGCERSWYVMFLCHVAVGRTHTTTAGGLEQAEIDALVYLGGVDSVTGEMGPNLNFDEVVTYDEASAVPSFLIAYTMSSA